MIIFPAQLASPKAKENADVRVVAFGVVVAMQLCCARKTIITFDWTNNHNHLTSVQDKRQRRGNKEYFKDVHSGHKFSKLDKKCMYLSAVLLTVLLIKLVTVCSIHQTFTVYQDIVILPTKSLDSTLDHTFDWILDCTLYCIVTYYIVRNCIKMPQNVLPYYKLYLINFTVL